jgi:hypothetical protein
VLLTDLRHALHDLELLLQSTQKGRGGGPILGCFGASAAQKKKMKTDRGIVNALKDVVKNAFRELQILQTATSHSNKHRSELERMVEALLEKEDEEQQAMKYTPMGSLPGMGGMGAVGGSAGGAKKKDKKKGVGFAAAAEEEEDEEDKVEEEEEDDKNQDTENGENGGDSEDNDGDL